MLSSLKVCWLVKIFVRTVRMAPPILVRSSRNDICGSSCCKTFCRSLSVADSENTVEENTWVVKELHFAYVGIMNINQAFNMCQITQVCLRSRIMFTFVPHYNWPNTDNHGLVCKSLHSCNELMMYDILYWMQNGVRYFWCELFYSPRNDLPIQ